MIVEIAVSYDGEEYDPDFENRLFDTAKKFNGQGSILGFTTEGEGQVQNLHCFFRSVVNAKRFMSRIRRWVAFKSHKTRFDEVETYKW